MADSEEANGNATMADCRAEVDQEIEGGHCDDTAEERQHGHAQWLVLTDTVQNLDDSLEHVDNDLKVQSSTAQMKLAELKTKERKLLEKNLETLRIQWISKCRELGHLKQSLRKFSEDRAGLRTENQYYEKMISRLQEQFTEAVDSSLAEIQELTVCNSELSQRVQTLEGKLELGEKKLRRILHDNFEGLRKVSEAASKDDAKLEDICTISKDEIRKLERSETLESMFQIEVDDSRDFSSRATNDLKGSFSESRIQSMMSELAESRHLIDNLRQNVRQLEKEKEELVRKEFKFEEDDNEKQLIDHILKSVSSTCSSYDIADAVDFTAVRKEIIGVKKISQKLRSNLAYVYKSVLSKEDELSDLRDNIDEINMRWKNSSTKMESMEQENDFLRRKVEQEESRSKISSDEIASLQNRIQMLEREKKSFKEQIQDLRDGKDDLKTFCNNLTKENEKFLQDITRLQNERDTLLEQLQDTTRKASESAQESLNIEERHSNIEKALNRLRREYQEQNREFVSITKENEDLKLLLQEQQGEREKYKNEFRNIDIVNKDLEDQVFQLSNENDRLSVDLERTKTARQLAESELRETKVSLQKKESVETHHELKIKELTRTLRDNAERMEALRSDLQQKSCEVSKVSERISNLDLFLRQFLRQRRELLSLVTDDKENPCLQNLSALAGTNFELDADDDVSQQERKLPIVLEESFETLLKSMGVLQTCKEELEGGRQKVIQLLRANVFSSKFDNNELDKADGNITLSDIITELKKFNEQCINLDNENKALEKTSTELKHEHADEIVHLEQLQTKTSRKLSITEQKQRTLMLKLKNKKNVETALRGKISRLRKEVKDIKVQTKQGVATNTENQALFTDEVHQHQTVDGLAEWREFMREIVEEFNLVKEKTERCIEEDQLSVDSCHGDSPGNTLDKKNKDISLQIQTLLRNTREALTEKEREIEEQLQGKKILEDKLEKAEFQFEALNKDRQACLNENSKLKQCKDMILKYTVAATKQLEIILENLSGKECVIMFQRRPELTEKKSTQDNSHDELMSFVRDTLKANERTLQASIATLEMVKQKGLCDFVPDEDLFLVDPEQREMLKILRRMNQSVDSVTKRLRTLMIGAEYVRAGSLHDLSCKDLGRYEEVSEVSNTKVEDLEESLSQKEELLKILEAELDQLKVEKDKLVTDIQNKDLNLETLRSDVKRLTVSSQGLESELTRLKSDYELTLKLLKEREEDVTRLNDVLKQHEEGRLDGDFDREEAVSTLERKKGEIKWLRTNLNDIRNVHIVNENRIRTLQDKIEGVTKYLCDRENESDSGLTNVSRDSALKEQIFVVKELEVKSSKAEILNVGGDAGDSSGQQHNKSRDKPDNSQTSDKDDAKLEKELRYKEKENLFLQSAVKELKLELQNVQRSLKSVNDSKTMLQSQFPNVRKSSKNMKPRDVIPTISRNTSTKTNNSGKETDDSSDTLTIKSDGSSALFTYGYPLRLKGVANHRREPYDPHDCDICSQATDASNFVCSDDDCGCHCSDCEGSDASCLSDEEYSKPLAPRGYMHNINSSREARKVSLREATQVIRARNRRMSPERVRTSNRRSLSPSFFSSPSKSLSKAPYESESVSSSDYPSPNFRHPRKVSHPKFVKPRPKMVRPPTDFDSPTYELNHTNGSMKSISVRSQFSSDESQGEGKHSSSSGNRSCTSPLECKGHDCKKRKRNKFSLQLAASTREKGGK